ncbi:MAG: phosphotransferase [Paracoccaceae bacterium]|nr:phosphotransferase [Paracoccaceae bacterium]
MTGGRRNTVLLARDDKSAWVYKTTKRSEAQLAWLKPLAAHANAAGFDAVLPHPTLSGALSHNGWTVEPFCKGRRFDPRDRTRLRVVLDRFHKATVDYPQRPGFASARDLLGQDTGGDVDLTEMPVALRQTCRTAWSALPEGPECALHGDLCADNILVGEDGRFVLLDWDEARCDLPLFDLSALGEATDSHEAQAALAFEIATCWGLEPDYARSLLPHLSLLSEQVNSEQNGTSP